MYKKKTLTADLIFEIAVAMLPFENLFFAPSAGWAAISPILFAMYLALNIRCWKYPAKRFLRLEAIVAIGFFITIANYIIVVVTEHDARTTPLRAISTLVSLILGFVSLYSFYIYFIVKGKSLKKIERILLIAYTISMLIGIAQFFTIIFNIAPIRMLDSILSKRTYLPYNRVQFTFTEPSFIGMHLFGVLLPIYVYGHNKKILKLIVAYWIVAIVCGAGVRIILDGAVVLMIYSLFKMNFRNTKKILSLIAIGCVMLAGINIAYQSNYRVRQIMNLGIYADGSLASRYFRINATVKGYIKDPVHTLLGYGYGQEVVPLEAGYQEAARDYKSYYMDEVISLKNAGETSEESVSYCLWTRIVSELGVILAIALFYMYFQKVYYTKSKEQKAIFVIVGYLYIQFESYAFYSVWLIIVLHMLKIKERENYEKSISLRHD